MNLQDQLRRQTRQFYDNRAHSYRVKGDKQARTLPGFQKYFTDLRNLCQQKSGQVNVLELGCGTGRYFSCLQNVNNLVGIDLSGNMLLEASETIRATPGIDAKRIMLLNANVHRIERLFRKSCRFDLIYSIGVFAEYTRLSLCDLDAIYNLLTYGGSLYLTTVQRCPGFEGYVRRLRARTAAFGRSQIARYLYLRRLLQWLPAISFDKKIDYSILYLSHKRLLELLRKSRFTDFRVETHIDSKHTHDIIIAKRWR